MVYKEEHLRSATAKSSMPQPARALQLVDSFFTRYLWVSHTQASGLRVFQKHFPATRDIFGHVRVEEKASKGEWSLPETEERD